MNTVVLTKIVSDIAMQSEIISKNEPNKQKVKELAQIHMKEVYGTEKIEYKEYKALQDNTKIYTFHTPEDTKCIVEVKRCPVFEL